MSAGFEIINPAARVASGNAPGALPTKRVTSARGLRVGLLDNGMPHAGDFLAHLGAAFEKHHQTPLLARRKGHTALGAEREILEEIANSCDAVVTGFGV